jgi:diacylglycerol kinase (ATP)
MIVNPAAGNGRAKAVGRDATIRFAESRADFDLVETAAPEEAQLRAEEFLDREADGVIVVVGGDGTLHEVVQAFGRRPGRGTLAFLPAGGGNDAARTIGLPRDAALAARVALEGASRHLDLGICNGEFFFNGVGVGFDGAANAAYRRVPLLRGFPAYLAAALATLATYRKPRLKLECSDGAWEGPALLCAVGNGPSCGGGFRITPDADPADGLLDACVLGDFGRFEALGLLPKTLSGGHRNHPKASFFRSRELVVSADRELVAHFDGEVRKIEGPMRFSVAPGAIRVRVPQLPNILRP